MQYGIKTATVYFDDKTGDILKIETKAAMEPYPHNDWDVRNIVASGNYWKSSFLKWKEILQPIFQQTTAHGSEE